jgi:hypothetical protein
MGRGGLVRFQPPPKAAKIQNNYPPSLIPSVRITGDNKITVSGSKIITGRGFAAEMFQNNALFKQKKLFSMTGMFCA